MTAQVTEPDPHAGLKDYERGTQTWIRQVGHWHVTDIGGRRWVPGPVTQCPDVARVRRTL